MKNLKTIPAVLALLLLLPLAARADDLKSSIQIIEKANAEQAMALANQWKWTRNGVKTYVTSQEVVFDFPNNIVKTVALPEDKMVVAIAPYLTYTHQ